MKPFLQILLALNLASCISYGPDPDSAASGEYPPNWPQPVPGDFAPDECISLDGVYQSGGESNSNLGERFINPIFEKNFFGLDDIANQNNRFRIRHDTSAKKLYFDFKNQQGEILSTGHIKKYVRCEQGWVVNESYVYGGSGDNPTISQRDITKRFLAEDGSLVFSGFSETVTSRFFVGRETQVATVWYRFKKVE